MRVRDAFREWLDIQLVAFPQSGVTTGERAPDLLASALAAGADLVGGLDPAGFDGDVRGQLDIIFGLAERFGKESTFTCTTAARPGQPRFTTSPNERSPPACTGASRLATRSRSGPFRRAFSNRPPMTWRAPKSRS